MSLKKALNFVMAPLGTIIGGKTGDLIASAGWIALGVMTGNPQLIMAGVARGAAALRKRPGISSSMVDRLHVDIVPEAPRKGALGHTALNTDGRYGAYTGANQEYWELIVCTASHEVQAHDEIWFDGDTAAAWTSGGGVAAKYSGYLTVTSRLVGTAANGIAIDSVWTTACTLTGCAYLHLKFKLTGNSKKAESPFASSIPSRMTIRGKGAKVPDPRLSTSAGGSGAQSMTDQATWAYTTAADSGRNPACQVLFYLLGWKIGGKLAVGKGVPAARIDFASFIAAANICDESVAKAGGGTQPRYRSDGVFSEADDPDTVLSGILAAMNAELTDENGKIAIRVDYDDLATPVLALTEDDIIDGDDWPLSNSARDVNIVKGQYTDPSDGALYQLRDYPQVTLTGADYGSPDGIQRIEPFPLPWVQDPAQAQRLAKLRLQRYQYPGTYSARFKKKAWAAGYGKVVTLTHASTNFSAKKFRVDRQVLHRDGSVTLVLREVATAMYSWSAEEAAVAAAAAPTPFNPVNDPIVGAVSDAGVNKVAIYKQSAAQPATPTGNGLPTGWSLYPNVTPWTQNLSGITATNNNTTFTKTGGTNNAYDASVWSTETFVNARVSFKPAQANLYFSIGLNSDPASSTNEASIDYELHCNNTGQLFARHSGTLQNGSAPIGTYAAGVDEIAVEHVGTTIVYSKNGTALFTATGVSASASLGLDSSFYSSGAAVNALNFSAAMPVGALPEWVSYGNQQIDGTLVGSWSAPVAWVDGETRGKTGKLDVGGRATDPTILYTAGLVGVKNTNSVALTAADAGATATISVPAHSRKVPGGTTKSYNSGSITGLGFATKYYVYCDDANFAGGAVTYQATTNSDTLTGSTARVAVGEITTPADGAAGTSGGGVPPGSQGGGGGSAYP